MAGLRKTTPKQLAALRPFPKGVSGNPAGKKKGTLSYTNALRKYLLAHPEEMEKGAKAMIKGVNRGNVGMTQIVLDRIDGPTKKKVDLNVYSEAFDDEEKAKLLDIITRNHPNHD